MNITTLWFSHVMLGVGVYYIVYLQLWEALFPGLDLDSGLDWTLDWTLENMYFWCHCSTKEVRGPVPCPLEAQTLIHVYVSW